MIEADFILNLFTPAGLYSVINIALTALLALYALFAFIVIRQINLMNNSFKTIWSFPFTFIGWVHFFLALALLASSLLL